MWKTLNKDNAIEGAAMTVRFAEPLSSMVAKRVVRDAESRASGEGFSNKEPLQQIQFQLEPLNADIRQASIVGMAFQHNSLMRDADGNVAPRLARQFVVQPEQIAMQLRRYRGWEEEWPASKKMIDPAITIAASIVPIAAFRLEYLNRFIYDGDAGDGTVNGLLRRSDFIAPHVFEAPDLFHSHTGRFDEISDSPVKRRLTQVNADLQNLAPPHPMAGNRTLALMIAVEWQFDPQGMELTSSEVDVVTSKYFSCLHDDIHALFKNLIESNFASENSLPR
ncbi:TIGR04255 family protein [Rhizobium bangladeshense]|uniref:TIGR04255 family protein n=1 Tax=Rhizobium bangladeshense TaxID=1138189 RepID=UPI001C835CFF|nr:TIGR04255 family protein [Rhizobium bangladeshense]MBX4884102.1 TIGR04255 family protein [Rhizobium bangladeshense]